jgi:5-methylcytosine-specific restriction endonuclease McrA
MKSSIPDGDLAALIEDAVSEKLERLEARRFATTNRPRKGPEETDTTPSSRHIPAPIRRAVYARDDGRCCFVDRSGRRCTARHDLEFHHRHGYARGGDHSVANLELQCPVHNQYLAELEYGRDRMQRYRKGVSEPMVPYSVGSAGASGRAIGQHQLRPDAVGRDFTTRAAHDLAGLAGREQAIRKIDDLVPHRELRAR